MTANSPLCEACPCPAAGHSGCPWRNGTHRHPTDIPCNRIRDGQAAWIAETLRQAEVDARTPHRLENGVTIDTGASSPSEAPFVAPANGFGHEGPSATKPWQYRVTATLACLNSPELVEVAVGLLRLQTVAPYIIVVDTGSSRSNLDRLESLRDHDLEIHHVRAGGYQHSSDPVAIACDLAQARCQTEYMYFTHADCFTRRKDWLESLLAQCDAATPVVGYQLTDRSFATAEWKWMVGHTATMVHVPTIRRGNCWWSYQWMADAGVKPESETYWDTEVGFCWALKRAGIVPKLIGTEKNYARNLDGNIDHVRSFASRQIYGEMIGTAEYRANVEGWASAALSEGRQRIVEWSRPPTPDPSTQTLPILPACPHRGGTWSCCSTGMSCAAGKGSTPDDCRTCQEPALPGLWTQLANFAAAMKAHAASGFAMATDEAAASRLSLCKGCPMLRPSDGRCAECGCWVAEKVHLESSECPAGKW